MKPLLCTATWIVFRMLVYRQSNPRSLDCDLHPLICEINWCRCHADDGADDIRKLLCHCDQRIPLGIRGASIDDQGRFRNGLLPTQFVNAKVLIADNSGDDRQTVESNAIDRASIDFPGEYRLSAGGFGFTAHQAAACEYFRGPRLDI